jgi:osmotically-inducible protein OsmY
MLTADSDAIRGNNAAAGAIPGRAAPLPTHLQVQWRQLQSRYSSLHGVVVDERGESVHLKGRVPSQYLKQIALAVACQIAGTRPVVNEIQVDPRRRTEKASPESRLFL